MTTARACAEQDAAAAVERAHPVGIDVLVANAGVGGVSDLNTLNIDLCAAARPAGGLLGPYSSPIVLLLLGSNHRRVLLIIPVCYLSVMHVSSDGAAVYVASVSVLFMLPLHL